MNLVRTLTVLVTCAALCLPTSACGLFPFLPTYGGYGYGYGGYVSCGYYGYSSCGYRGCGYIASPCCTPCSSCCTTSCGSSCDNSCGATEVRKEAIPDSNFDQKRSDDDDRRGRTFRGGDSETDSDDDDRSRSRSFGSGRDAAPGTRSDDFGTESGSESGQGDAGRWTPPGADRSNSREFGDSLLDRIPGSDEFGDSSSQKPLTEGLDGSGISTPDAGTESGSSEIIDHGARRPPITAPVEEGGSNQNSGSETETGIESGSTEFLGPDGTARSSATDRRFLTNRDLRSSHFGVISAPRLAGESDRSVGASSSTAISSGKKRTTPVRWISVPAPGGSVRL